MEIPRYYRLLIDILNRGEFDRISSPYPLRDMELLKKQELNEKKLVEETKLIFSSPMEASMSSK